MEQKGPNNHLFNRPCSGICVYKVLGYSLPTLADMTNQSLQGILPSSLKSAIIIPTLKGPSTDLATLKNYRLIRIFHYLRKVIKRIVIQQLMNYMNLNSLQPSRQSTYRGSFTVLRL